jgi:hypothetical protein
MRSLTFRCPTTGIGIDAGFQGDPDTLSQLRLFTLSVVCAACGATHRFSVGEAHGATQDLGLGVLMAPADGTQQKGQSLISAPAAPQPRSRRAPR